MTTTITPALSNSLALATQYISKRMPSLLTQQFKFLSMCMDNKEWIDGARYLQFPLNTKPITSLGAINGISDIMDVNPQQQLSFGNLTWKHHYLGLGVSQKELAEVGKAGNAVETLLKAKTRGALSDFQRMLASQAMGTSASDSRAWDGILDMAAASGTSYAGLTNTDTTIFNTTSDWLFDRDTTTSAVTYGGINKEIEKLKSRCQGLMGQSGETYKIDTMLSNYAVRSEYMALVNPQYRLTDTTDAKTGFDSVTLQNGIKWYVDNYAGGSADGSTADNYLFILASAAFGLKYVFGLDHPSPFDVEGEALPRQTIEYNLKTMTSNIYCENRRVNAVYTALVV